MTVAVKTAVRWFHFLFVEHITILANPLAYFYVHVTVLHRNKFLCNKTN
jgi:hypothetical protein